MDCRVKSKIGHTCTRYCYAFVLENVTAVNVTITLGVTLPLGTNLEVDMTYNETALHVQDAVCAQKKSTEIITLAKFGFSQIYDIKPFRLSACGFENSLPYVPIRLYDSRKK